MTHFSKLFPHLLSSRDCVFTSLPCLSASASFPPSAVPSPCPPSSLHLPDSLFCHLCSSCRCFSSQLASRDGAVEAWLGVWPLATLLGLPITLHQIRQHQCPSWRRALALLWCLWATRVRWCWLRAWKRRTSCMSPWHPSSTWSP